MIQIEKTKMIFTACGTEAIGIDYDEEDDLTSLAFWQLGMEYKLTWRDRVRWIFQIIKGHRPYTDMVMLNEVERTALISALQEYTLETKPVIVTTSTGD